MNSPFIIYYGNTAANLLTPRYHWQMMFVAGETAEPSSETLLLVEQIVHEQVQEMVSRSDLEHLH